MSTTPMNAEMLLNKLAVYGRHYTTCPRFPEKRPFDAECNCGFQALAREVYTHLSTSAADTTKATVLPELQAGGILGAPTSPSPVDEGQTMPIRLTPTESRDSICVVASRHGEK
jgi:hypothetical protein